MCYYRQREANPEAEFKDISNILGTKWKKWYEDKYQYEMEVYLKVIGNVRTKRWSGWRKSRNRGQQWSCLTSSSSSNRKQKKQTTKRRSKFTSLSLSLSLIKFFIFVWQERARNEKDSLKPKYPMSAFFVFASRDEELYLHRTRAFWR